MDDNNLTINKNLSIPLSELQFRFATSGGPGGQHANKSETRVILSFDVLNSPSLDEQTRRLLLEKLASRLDKNGVLQISVQDSRSQKQNRETAVSRFQTRIAQALIIPKKRRKTKPSRAAKEKRLIRKKQKSNLKRQRGRDWKSEIRD